MTKWATMAVSRHGQSPAKHHRLLLNKLESLSRGERDRLMIQMPPGSAKSTYASILLPAWWFTQHPEASIMMVGHTNGLATYFGRRARAVIAEEANSLGYHIDGTSRAGTQWATSNGGEYYAVGIRGAIIGRRADLAIIDDPIRSLMEANNSSHRDHLWNWYCTELVPRLKPKARIVLVMTRWHEDDLCGRLLEHEHDQWECLKLPALAEASDQMDRIQSEPLWPEWEGLRVLERRRATAGERTWSAQFQQSPQPLTGGLLMAEAIECLDVPPTPPEATIVRAWDLAATTAGNDRDPDWTVGIKLLRNGPRKFTILDVVRFRGTPRQVEDTIVATARLDGRNVPIGLPEDPGQAGKSQVSYLAGSLAGYHIVSSRETGAKTTRALPVASQIEAGNLAIVRASWNHLLMEELREFPNGRKDDQVDALSRAFNMLLEAPAPHRTALIAHMAR
jgi:predicted phage terminase large subunit-like protein